MTNDDHTGTRTPTHAAEWVPPSGAPPNPHPGPPQPRPKNRTKLALLVVFLSAVAIAAIIGIHRLSPSPPTPDDQRSYTSAPTVGYSGDATSTGSLSPAWASGV